MLVLSRLFGGGMLYSSACPMEQGGCGSFLPSHQSVIALWDGGVGYLGKASMARIATCTGFSYQQVSWLPWTCREQS